MIPGFKAILHQKINDNDYKSKNMFLINLGLTLLLQEKHLFDIKYFSNVVLSDVTRQLMEQKPEGFSLICLNRLLLEDAYPEELKKTIKAIIFKGNPRTTRNPKSKHPAQLEIPYFINQDTRIFEIIIYNLIEKEEWAKINLKHVEDLCEKKAETFRNQTGPEGLELDQEELDKVLYKGHNRDFYSKVDYESTQKIIEFMSSNYTGYFIKNFGLEVMLRFLDDPRYETERAVIASRALENGFIDKK